MTVTLKKPGHGHNTRHDDTAILEKLEHNMVGIQQLINIFKYNFIIIFQNK